MLAIHNVAHNPLLALTVLLVAAVTGLSPFVYVGTLAWLGHIVVGWGTGDRMKPAGSPLPARRDTRTDPLVPVPAVATGALR